jgi:hypothetical protein
MLSFFIEHGDVVDFRADVMALKFAGAFYGADRAAMHALVDGGLEAESLTVSHDGYRLVPGRGSVGSRQVLFIGVGPLYDLDYEKVRWFGHRALRILRDTMTPAPHVAMTIHGPHIGLDESESLRAEFNGIMDAIQAGEYPSDLTAITIVDRDERRVARLRKSMDQTVANLPHAERASSGWGWRLPLGKIEKRTRAAGSSRAKGHIFVAMPFTPEMEDVFYYGIQQPIHALGFLCERIDRSSFTGDIVDHIKKKIDSAAAVVAELSGANPNVYLEVGYAWGVQRPTVLICRNHDELQFDVKGHKCLAYKSIKQLEKALEDELRQLVMRRVL